MLKSVDRSLAILLMFSLLIKLLLVAQTDIINSDGIRYINSASELFQGHFSAAFAHEKMLGYSFLLGLSHLIIPDWFLAGKILSCLAMVLTTIPLYFLARELFGERAAFYTALVYTVVPSVNGKVTSVIKDPAFLFFVVVILWLSVHGLKHLKWWPFLVAGILCCVSVTIRPEGIVLYAVISLSLLALFLFVPTARKLKLACLGAFGTFPLLILTFIVALVLAGIATEEILSSVTDRFSSYFRADLKLNYITIYQHLKDVEKDFVGGVDTHDFFEYARSNMLLIYLVGMLQTFFEKMYPVFVLPLFFGFKFKAHWDRCLFLFVAVLTSFLLMDYVFLLSRNFLASRYLLVPIVLAFVIVGYGIERIAPKIINFRFRKVAYSFVFLLCIALPLVMPFRKVSHEKDEIKNVGIWLNEQRKPAQSNLIVNDERIAFYAGLLRGKYHTFPTAELISLEEKALRLGSELIVVYVKQNEVDNIPHFKNFTRVESFKGRRKIAMVYERHI